MIKKLLFFIFCIISTGYVTAQDALAKIEYSYAEEAYAKKDYRKTLEHLEEVKNLLGSTNAKVMYLEISSIDKLETRDVIEYFEYIKKIKILTTKYITNFEKEVPIEKLKSVYDIKKEYEMYFPEIDNLIKGIKLGNENKYDEASEYYKIACDAGNAAGCHNLSIYYFKSGNNDNNMKYLNKAVDLGLVNSISEKGFLVYNGYGGYQQNMEEGIKLLLDAYNKKFTSRAYVIGDYYFEVKQNREKAKEYYEATSIDSQEYNYSRYMLLVYYEYTDKKTISIVKEYLNHRIELNDTDKGASLYQLGYIQFNYEKNYSRAFQNFKEACEENLAIACDALSTIYSDKQVAEQCNTEKNSKLSKEYRNKACALNPQYCN